MNELMWYIPAGSIETIWFLICAVVSYRLCRALERCDKPMKRSIYVRSETTGWEGWTEIRR